VVDGFLAADTVTEIKAHLEPHIIKNYVLRCDGAWAYVDIAKKINCDHKRLISSKIGGQDKIHHIQIVDGTNAHFKGG